MKSAKTPSSGSGHSSAKKQVRLDEADVKILAQLAQDSRISQRALARTIGMSPPAVADRITRLERAGVIQGYRAQLDYALLGRPMTVLIEVLSDRSSTQVELARRLATFPEVERVDVLTGRTDLQVRLRVRDQDHLNEVLFDRLWTASSEIQRTETHLALVTIEPEDFAVRLVEAMLEDLSAERADEPSG